MRKRKRERERCSVLAMRPPSSSWLLDLINVLSFYSYFLSLEHHILSCLGWKILVYVFCFSLCIKYDRKPFLLLFKLVETAAKTYLCSTKCWPTTFLFLFMCYLSTQWWIPREQQSSLHSSLCWTILSIHELISSFGFVSKLFRGTSFKIVIYTHVS